MSKSLKIQVFIMLIFVMMLSVACDNGSGIIQDAQNDVNSKIAIVDATITTASDMVETTVIDGCGAFSNSLESCQ